MTRTPQINRRAPAPLSLALAVTGTILASAALAQNGEVNVYTYREPALIKPLFDKFTAETGIKVNVVFANSGLEERIQSEGDRSPADLLLSVDVSRLENAVALGIVQPMKSAVLEKAVPVDLRAKDGSWFAVSARARVIYVAKDRVKDTALTYEDLANPKWRGRLCTRDGQHYYNTALIAAAITHMGPAKAEDWVKGLRANLAKKPSGGDRDVAKDIAAGACDIGIGNTYYIGLMHADANQKAWADAMRVIMPTFKDGGTHVNISGVALTKHAKNKVQALRLAEWLVSASTQEAYAAQNHEYPVLDGVKVDPYIASFGALRKDRISLEEIAKHRKTASEIVDRTGYNQGPNS